LPPLARQLHAASAGRAIVRRRLRAAGSAARRWLARHLLVLVTGIAAALPIVVSMGERVAVDWVPLADNAVIAVRSLDVLTTDTPLLGQWSSGPSGVLEEDVYAPGPLLYWLLALPARLPGAVWLELAMGLVNVISVVGVVALAHRRGGRALMFAAAFAVALMFASLPAESLSDIWNPSAPLAPFILLIFLCWSLACGEYRLLPLTALVASFVVQGHLAYVAPALGVLAVGLAGLVLSRSSVRRPPDRRWGVAAILIVLACFSLPLLEQAIHRPGNLVRLGRAATAADPTLGLELGRHALVRAVGIVPWWLREPRIPLERIGDLTVAPGAVAAASTLLVLSSLGAACVVGRRRRRADVVAAGALGLVLCAAVLIATASTPRSAFTGVGYTLRWTSPAGMWVWLAVCWSLVTLLRPRLPHAPAVPPALASLAGVAVVASVGGLVAAGAAPRQESFRAMRAIGARLEQDLPRGRTTRVDATSTPNTSFIALDLQAGIVYWLRREGRAVTAPGLAHLLGDRYRSDGRDEEQLLRVDIDTAPPDRGRVIARLTVPELHDPGDPLASPAPTRRSVTVTLVPPRAAR
jgi:hypothetical protein